MGLLVDLVANAAVIAIPYCIAEWMFFQRKRQVRQVSPC